MGESYDGIRALADLFASLKYPTSFMAPLPGNSCCSDFEPSCSSYIFKNKKNLFSFSLALPSPLLPILLSYLFAFLISTSTPATLGRLSSYTLPSLWGESLEPLSLDLVPHPATRSTLMPYRSSRVRRTLTHILDYRSMPIKSSESKFIS